VLTQSRGGQLVVLAALGVYLFRRLGFRGLVIAGVLLLPMVLFGGRSGSESESSTEERLETWAQGWEMFRSSPLLGVGMGQFTQHHHLTAHSSYILSYAEQGFPGYYLFTIILYLSIKIPVMVLMRSREMARVAVTWSVSMLAAWIGLLVGIAFLSYTYKEQLWIFIGLTGALYHCVKAHVSDFDVGLGWGEAALLAVFDVGLILFLHLYTVYKGVA